MFAWYTLGREWPWISGSLSEPLSCDFSGIVIEGFTIPESSVGSESASHFNMSFWSWVQALMEAKEKGMGHAPIACEWDHPSSEWARGWGPYNTTKILITHVCIYIFKCLYAKNHLESFTNLTCSQKNK